MKTIMTILALGTVGIVAYGLGNGSLLRGESSALTSVGDQPWAIMARDVTPELLAACRVDDNCMDVMPLDPDDTAANQ